MSTTNPNGVEVVTETPAKIDESKAVPNQCGKSSTNAPGDAAKDGGAYCGTMSMGLMACIAFIAIAAIGGLLGIICGATDVCSGAAEDVAADGSNYYYYGSAVPTPEPTVADGLTPAPTPEPIDSGSQNTTSQNATSPNATSPTAPTTYVSATPQPTTTTTIDEGSAPTTPPPTITTSTTQATTTSSTVGVTSSPTPRPTSRPTSRPTPRPTPLPTEPCECSIDCAVDHHAFSSCQDIPLLNSCGCLPERKCFAFDRWPSIIYRLQIDGTWLSTSEHSTHFSNAEKTRYWKDVNGKWIQTNEANDNVYCFSELIGGAWPVGVATTIRCNSGEVPQFNSNGVCVNCNNGNTCWGYETGSTTHFCDTYTPVTAYEVNCPLF